MAEWHVSGHYTMTVEADTEEEAINYACDKIGSGWEWEAVRESGIPARPTAICGCGFPLIWLQGYWIHDAPAAMWGDDHDPHADDPAADDPARVFWDREDCVEEEES